MASEVSTKAPQAGVLAVFALRSKLIWQKMCRLDEGIIKNTKAELTKSYSSRASMWRESAEEEKREISYILDDINEEMIGFATHRAIQKFSLWRSAVLSSKAAKLFYEAKEFISAGAEWKNSAQSRESLAIYYRWGFTYNSNSRKSAVDYLIAGNAYMLGGDQKTANQLLNRGTQNVAYHFAGVSLPEITFETATMS